MVDNELDAGWTIDKKNQRSIRLKRKKSSAIALEDKVWTLLYRMGFSFLSDERGAELLVDPKQLNGPKTKIDVVGIDEDVALAIECKSAESRAKRPQFQHELGKHTLIRKRFAQAITKQFPTEAKRQTALVMFVTNSVLTENDLKRAEAEHVVVFDEHDLEYYEELVSHLGPAMKYQFFADILPGKAIPGLSISVPAVRTKMGGYNCYTFSIHPKYLLKIAYVSHRSKGKASDVDTYQRMIRKSRVKKIREYISNDGIFPTNIVINLDMRPQFDRGGQVAGQEGGVIGFVRLKPTFRSAWIIDGQHRLFAYSGLSRAATDYLSVLAFEKIPPSDQARLFIDINGQQKSVKQSLLRELYAELHWNAVEPQERVAAIVSKTVQVLDASPESPFFERIVMADERRTDLHCISFQGLAAALERTDFFIATVRKGAVVRYGPLWAGDDNQATLNRTVFVLNRWFGLIKRGANDWWCLGAALGGGLAMNDGVVACVEVLRSVFQHLEDTGTKLIDLDNEDLAECLNPYGSALGTYLGSLTDDERRQLRGLRGMQGQTTFRRRCQQGINERIPSFNPDGLQEFLENEKSQTNDRAKEVVDQIERLLQSAITEELKREFGAEDSQWWMLGVPKPVRLKVSQRHEDDDGSRGSKEYYFDLIDYRAIILQHWELFGPTFGMDVGRGNAGKDKRTQWLHEVNAVRRVVAHASSGVAISTEQLEQMQHYEQRLCSRLRGGAELGLGETDDEQAQD